MAKRSRTERRQLERDLAKLARGRVKLAALEPGGAPDRPIEVASASVVELHASSTACAACGEAGVRVDAHEAISVVEAGQERRLRVARVRCPQCGHRRDVFFRIGTALPS